MINIQCGDDGIPGDDMCYRIYEECVETETAFRLLKTEEINVEEFDANDLFFGDVRITTEFIRRFIDPDFEILDCYPDELHDFYGREIRRMSFAEFKRSQRTLFVKPVETKLFDGVVGSFEDIEPYLPDDCNLETSYCYVANVVNIYSEYRCFVHRGELVGLQHGEGAFDVFPDVEQIKDCISQYTQQPVAFCLDVGLMADRQVVVEVNEILCSGSFGFDSDVLTIQRDRYREIREQASRHRSQDISGHRCRDLN